MINRCLRGSNVHLYISARQSNVEIHLCDRKKLCSTYQTHNDSKVITSCRSLRSTSQGADIESTRRENWQSLLLDRFFNNVEVVTT